MDKTKKSNIFDYFFILRPLILIPVWDFFLIGCYLARHQRGFTLDIVLGLFIYTALMGGVYILNQILDIETDRVNKKLFILSEGFISTRNAYLEMTILWIIALALSFRFGLIFAAFIIISLLLGILYSVRPVKLKGKPILDMLSNGIGYGIINFAVGWFIFQPFHWDMFIKFLPYFLSICAVFVNTTIVDMEGDKKAGEITTAVFLRERFSFLLSTVLIAFAVIISIFLKDLICLVPAAISFPLFAYTALFFGVKNRVNRPLTIASFRLPGLLFTIMTALLYPIYIAVLFILFVSMRRYYKARFGMVYPTLSGG